MATTHCFKILRNVFSFELSSVALSDTEVDNVGAASVEAMEDVVEEAGGVLIFAGRPDDEEAMIK